MKTNTIQFKIFIFYGSIAAVCVFLCAIFLTSEAYGRLSAQAKEQLLEDVARYSDSVDQEVQAMDNSALACLFDTKVQDFLNHTYMGEIQGDEVAHVASTLTSSILFSDMVHQALLHLQEGKSVTSRSNTWIATDVTSMAWYDQVFQAKGRMVLTAPYLCTDRDMSTDFTTNRYLISLCRLSHDTYRVPKGVLEIRQYASEIFSAFPQDGSCEIVVLDSLGQVVYPYDVDPATLPAYLTTLPTEAQAETAYLSGQDREHLIAHYGSRQTGYTILVEQPTTALLFATREYVLSVIFIATAILLFLLLFSYYAAHRLTKPMARLRGRMARSADISVPLEQGITSSGILELDQLEEAFVSMRGQLDNSVHQQLLAQQQELQYKFLAIQSQMNPHFLHNSLANISAMADEGQVDQIGYMCKRLSTMLRYIASNREGHVTIQEELAFATAYTDSLKVRFGTNLECTFQTDETARELPIPKLSIQPLLENSIKHCRDTNPPYRLAVTTQVQGQGFTVTVTDNGPGFSPEALASFYGKIHNVDKHNHIPNIELDGMGLLNIYLRLRLLYGENTIFQIENLPVGGSVRIGTRKVEPHES